MTQMQDELDLAKQETRKAYEKEREDIRIRATMHFIDFQADAMRELRRARKAVEAKDIDLALDRLKAARLAVKSTEDACRRMR